MDEKSVTDHFLNLTVIYPVSVKKKKTKKNKGDIFEKSLYLLSLLLRLLI